MVHFGNKIWQWNEQQNWIFGMSKWHGINAITNLLCKFAIICCKVCPKQTSRKFNPDWLSILMRIFIIRYEQTLTQTHCTRTHIYVCTHTHTHEQRLRQNVRPVGGGHLLIYLMSIKLWLLLFDCCARISIKIENLLPWISSSDSESVHVCVWVCALYTR